MNNLVALRQVIADHEGNERCDVSSDDNVDFSDDQLVRAIERKFKIELNDIDKECGTVRCLAAIIPTKERKIPVPGEDVVYNEEETKKKLLDESGVCGCIEVSIGECSFCGEEAEGIDVDDISTAKEDVDKTLKQLWDKGWRYVNSMSQEDIVLACPECAKLPDDERGGCY